MRLALHILLPIVLIVSCASQEPQSRSGTIEYEVGSEEIAAQIAKNLPATTSRVEKGHQHRFKRPPRVYVFATESKFEEKSGYVASLVAGVSTPSGLYLAPQSYEQMLGVLQHELSHALLRQWIGSYRFHRTPIWFREGLATWVAAGGGADSVSEDEARQALRDNQTFTPNLVEGIVFRKGPEHWELSHHMFYRQSGLFIDYLSKQNPMAWKKLLDNVHAGMDFKTAYGAAFDTDLQTLWNDFSGSR